MTMKTKQQMKNFIIGQNNYTGNGEYEPMRHSCDALFNFSNMESKKRPLFEKAYNELYPLTEAEEQELERQYILSARYLLDNNLVTITDEYEEVYKGHSFHHIKTEQMIEYAKQEGLKE